MGEIWVVEWTIISSMVSKRRWLRVMYADHTAGY